MEAEVIRAAWALAWGALSSCSRPVAPQDRQARIDELYAGYRSAFVGVPEIDAPTLGRWLDEREGVVLVDVRTDAERAVSTLPGAVRAEEVEAEPGRWLGRRLVAYCTIGARSGAWAERERAAGLDVTNLAGGVVAWTWTGRMFDGPDGPTRRVHVYGARWDLVDPRYPSTY